MDTANILSELRAERERIEQAIAALEALDSTSTQSAARTLTAPPQQAGKGKRTMSAAARSKISIAAKKRWAQRKGTTATKSTVKKSHHKQTAPKGGITPAGRRRLSELMKKRWAARKRAAKKAA